MRSHVLSVTVLGILAFAEQAHASDYSYVPNASNCDKTWQNPVCWQPTGTPGMMDTAALGAWPNVTLTSNVSGLQGLTTSGTAILGAGGLSVEVAAGGNQPALVWGGDAALAVKLVIDAGVTATVDGMDVTGGELDNAGTLTWLGGDFIGDSGGIIRNAGTFVVTPASGSFTYGAGLNTVDFYNTGTISFTKGGTVDNPSGMWGFHNTGVINFTLGGTFEWRASSNTQHTLDAGGSITGNGTLLYDDPASLSTLTITGTTKVGAGATLAVGTGAVVNAGTGGATIDGPGTFLWTGGSITGTANQTMQPALTWASGLAVHLTGPASKDSTSSYIVNDTSVLWDQGQFGVGDSSYLTNTGTFTAKGDATTGALSIGGGPTSTSADGTLENRGTFVKSAGTAALDVQGLSFLNYGTINGASGSIVLQTFGNTTDDGTSANVLEAGSTLQGSIISYCETTLAGASTVAAASTFELGNDGMGDQALLDGSGSLGGAGTVKIDGASLTSSGIGTAITFASGGNVLLSNNAATTEISVDSTATLTFAGTTSWTGGSLEIDSGTVTNSGAWTTTTGGTFSVNTSGSHLTNTGSFTANPGASAMLNMDVVTVNSGTVTLQSGTTLFPDNYTQTAGSTVLEGGVLSTSRGGMDPEYSTVDIQGGTLTGSGTVDAILTNEGTVAPGTTSAAGTITVTQTYAQSGAGTLAIGLGGVAAGKFDVLSVTQGATIAGTLAVARIGSYVPAVAAQYDVVVSTGLTGTFSTVTPPAFVTLSATYTANDAVLGVTAVEPFDAGAGDDGGGVDGGATDSGASTDTGSPDAGRPSADAGSHHDAGHSSGDAGPAKSTGSGDAGNEDGGGSAGSGGGCSESPEGSGSSLGFAFGLLVCIGAVRLGKRRSA